jgi:hypothetical protein
MTMTKLAGAAALALGLSLAGSAGAAPLPNALDAIGSAASQNSLVQKAHGCHRNWVRGWSRHYGRRLVHRHAGRYCQPVRPRRHYGPGRPYNWRYRGCFSIGPIWYCP